MALFDTLNLLATKKQHQKTYWQGLVGSSLSQAIVAHYQQKPNVKLIVGDNGFHVNQLYEELRYLLPNNTTLLTLPDWEILPYERLSPYPDLISTRLATLAQVGQIQEGIILCAASTLMQQLCPTDFIAAHTLLLKKGETLNAIALCDKLTNTGYYATTKVTTPGEFARRGDIFDIFPTGSKTPLRIDLFDNEIETIKYFDPDTQRTTENLNHIRLLPAREFDTSDQKLRQFTQSFINYFDNADNDIISAVSKKTLPAGIEFYLPLFFDKTSTLFDYLPKNCDIYLENNLKTAINDFWQLAQNRYENCRHDIRCPILPPHELYLTFDQVHANLKHFSQILLNFPQAEQKQSTVNFHTTKPVAINVDAKNNPLKSIGSLAKDKSILLVTPTVGRKEAVLDLARLAACQIMPLAHSQQFFAELPPVAVCVAPFDTGFATDKIIVLTERELFGEQYIFKRRKKSLDTNPTDAVLHLDELDIGMAVVHQEKGVGRYLGLNVLTIDNKATEFLLLEYDKGDKLYVPITSLHLISRYSGADINHAPLNALGTHQWQRAKEKAAKRIRDVAAELLNVYARRQTKKGDSFIADPGELKHFAQGFGFEPTPDQATAIAAITDDLTQTKPMDRLICGDVGFGKTEVALRAAFIAVMNQKQVAMLVPTTLLAEQHFETFRDRFANWPVHVDVISRFRTKKEQEEIIAKLKLGKIDIIIGTHKLLQEDIKYKELGLLIIDEEHRFGVRQKEKLKALRAHINILTMTATPIPRTLNMALSHIRDLSLITTPPPKRQAIKTIVRQYDKNAIVDAITRELHRGGQVYYLHNDVSTIEGVKNKLEALMPNATVGVAHGQMRERDLEKIMNDFSHLRMNVLLCTTIIETGIDIPTANTIIIDRADRFGLAQLHQLRGRVGRSHHQAYAYLFTPDPKLMTKDAIKRLSALASLEDLGAGFSLAVHDLEIRGAGELLGDEQSGHMAAIGFSLYMELLDKAVAALKAGKEPDLISPTVFDVDIDLKLSALIPETYLPDVHTRLTLYKRLASVKSDDEQAELKAEMIDRFGLLPLPCQHLFQLSQLKRLANKLGVKKIRAHLAGGTIEFTEQPNINTDKLISLIQTNPAKYTLEAGTRLCFNDDLKDDSKRLAEVSHLLTSLLVTTPARQEVTL